MRKENVKEVITDRKENVSERLERARDRQCGSAACIAIARSVTGEISARGNKESLHETRGHAGSCWRATVAVLAAWSLSASDTDEV